MRQTRKSLGIQEDTKDFTDATGNSHEITQCWRQ